MSNFEAFKLAKRYIPGGVNSPVRSFSHVDGLPFFTGKAKKCFLYDIEDNKYIDYVCSWGANIVGHANHSVNQRLSGAIKKGYSFGTPTTLETTLAETICALIPSIEKVRLVNSGTEAVMAAIRLARGYTKRPYILKFSGCYHGHSDSMLVSAGSGVAAADNYSGVLEDIAKNTLVVDYNQTDGLSKIFRNYGENIAGVIFEPFAGNMNLIFPTKNFIEQLVSLSKQYGALLICDEVMTGFRVALGGGQSVLGITPDITILGKVVGGGMPLAAFGGKAKIMNQLSPLGLVYQAGTLSGNPIAVTCGLANLDIIQSEGFYDRLSSLTRRLTDGLISSSQKHGIKFCANYIGGLFGIHFQDELPNNLKQAQSANREVFNNFFHFMLRHGVFFAPSMLEAGFINIEHTELIIDRTIRIADKSFSRLAFN